MTRATRRPSLAFLPKILPRVRLHVDWGSSPGLFWLFALPGLVCLWLAVAQFTHGAAAQLLWTHAHGEVTGIEYRGGHRRSAPFTRFTFTTPDGRLHTARTPRTSAFHSAIAGDGVRIAYPADDPSRADLLHAGHLYGFALIHLLLAIVLGWLTRYNFDGAIHLSITPPKPREPNPATDTPQTG